MFDGFTAFDEQIMEIALEEASKAFTQDEVPVGAVLVGADGLILAKSFNQVISLCDPTAHAEIMVLRQAARKIGNYRILNSCLYVSVEPCAMCLMAAYHARVKKIIFGTLEPKFGACFSLLNFNSTEGLNHSIETRGGLLADKAANLMRDFFKIRRKLRCSKN